MGEEVIPGGQFGEGGPMDSLPDMHADAPYTAFLLDYTQMFHGARAPALEKDTENQQQSG